MGFLDLFRRPPSREKFATMYAAYLEKHGYAKPVRINHDDFQFKLGSGEQIFNLHNVYRDYCAADRAERDNVLERYAKGVKLPEQPTGFADARARIFPGLRGNGWLSMANRIGGPDVAAKSRLASRPLSSDTSIMLALDSEHAIQAIAASTLEEWGVSFDTAYAAALDNLRDITVAQFERVAPDLYVSAWNDSYDTSRVLLPDVIHQAGAGAAPAFMIPTRNRLLVASSANPTAVQQMIVLADQLAEEEGRWVSSKLYRLEDRQIVEFIPDDPELAGALKRLDLRFLAEDYGTLKADLDKQHEQDGTDIFVATFSVYEMNGRFLSLATWTDGVDTLLPKADAIAFVSPAENEDDTTYKLVRWDDAWPLVAGLMEVQDAYPLLYRVRGFPRADVLAQLEPIGL